MSGIMPCKNELIKASKKTKNPNTFHQKLIKRNGNFVHKYPGEFCVCT